MRSLYTLSFSTLYVGLTLGTILFVSCYVEAILEGAELKRRNIVTLESTYTGNENVIAQGIHEETAGNMIAFTIGGLVPESDYSWEFSPYKIPETPHAKQKQTNNVKKTDEVGKIRFTAKDIKNIFTLPVSDTEERQILYLFFRAVQWENVPTEVPIEIVYKPREIWTWQDLKTIKKYTGGSYKQQRDIEVSEHYDISEITFLAVLEKTDFDTGSYRFLKNGVPYDLSKLQLK